MLLPPVNPGTSIPKSVSKGGQPYQGLSLKSSLESVSRQPGVLNQ